MKRETVKLHYEQRRIVVNLDGWYPDGHLRQAKVNALWELQSASGEELSALMLSHRGVISALNRVFKGEL